MKQQKTIACACGCGATLDWLDAKQRPRRFLRGHFSKTPEGKIAVKAANAASQGVRPKGEWYKDSGHWRTSRWRARQLVSDASKCAWEHIGNCHGPIHVAHVDGDYTNNDRANLLPLCTSHHRLLDNGRIDAANPVMPSFYTDGGGKRRYEKR